MAEILEQAVSLGANPALKGVDSGVDSPLETAVVNNDVEYVRWLLEHKVSPYMYMNLDFLPDKDMTLLDFVREEDWDSELDEERQDDSRMNEIISIFSKY